MLVAVVMHMPRGKGDGKQQARAVLVMHLPQRQWDGKAAGPSHLRGGELARAQRLLRRIAGLALRQAQHKGGLVVRCAAGRDAVA